MPTKRMRIAAFALLLTIAMPMIVTAHAAATYKVQKGDSLYTIAQKHATTVDELKRLNKLSGSLIHVGQILNVSNPASNNGLYIIYTIRSGDTLGKIAEAFGTKTEFLRSLNGLSNDVIIAGKTLKVPAEHVNYTVTKGDTLWLLSQRFKTDVARIKLFSGITADNLYVGQQLLIPYQDLSVNPTTPPTVGPTVSYKDYTVVRGDTVWSVAVKFGIPMQELLSDNKLNTESTLNIGQKLKIAVHTVPVKTTYGQQFGEDLDWWTEAQYVFPINKTARVTDIKTGKSFTIKRTIGASHADCEPLTATDTATAKSMLGGIYSWNPRAVIVHVDGRRIAASMSFYPHGVEYVANNNFNGHFDLYFSNCRRHVDNKHDPAHQKMVDVAAGKR